MEFVALEVIAELGVALAGFAALAGVIRGNNYDAEIVFCVVAFGATAAVFALFAMRFAVSAESIRFLSGAMALAALLLCARGAQVFVAASREESIEGDPASAVLGLGVLLGLLIAPIISLLVVFGVYPARLAVLYESVLLCFLVNALLLLLMVVWRNFAVRQAAAAQQGVEPDVE